MQRYQFFICQIIVILGAMVLTACSGRQGNNSVASAYTPANSPISTTDYPSSQPSRTPLATRTPKLGHETPMSTPTSAIDIKGYANSWIRFYDHIYGISFEYPSIYEEQPYQDVCAPFETRVGAHFGENSEVFVFQRLGTTLDEHIQSFLPKYHPDEHFKLESQEAIQVNNQPAIAIKHKLGDAVETRELVFVTVSESKTIFTFSFIDGNACDVPEIGLTERTAFEHALETFYVEK